MDRLIVMLDSHFIYALGWTLVHSLWQALLIMLLLHFGLKLTQTIKPAVRYLLSLSALVCTLLLSGLTFYQNYRHSVLSSQDISHIDGNISLLYDNTFWSTLYQNINPWLSWVVIIWFIGFSLQFVKYLLDVIEGIQLKTNCTSPLNEEWQKRLCSLVALVQIKKKVEFKYSSKVSIPCIVGHFKPVVLLPLGILAQLPSEQIEAIVLHELAHIKRNDYLINLVQYLVKIVFFFNPFILNICRKIDNERETACDDIAVKVCGDPKAFALSLSRFAEFNQHQKSVLAATKDQFLLLNRVKRLFKHKVPVSDVIERLVLFVGIAILGLTLNVNAKEKFAVMAASLEAENSIAEVSKTSMESITNTNITAPTEAELLTDYKMENQSSETISDISEEPTESGDSMGEALKNHSSVLLASSARDYSLNIHQIHDADDENDNSYSKHDISKNAKILVVSNNVENEDSPLLNLDQKQNELPLVAIKNSGFQLALFSQKIAEHHYRGIKILPIDIDKTVIDAKFKRWESITYEGLKDSLNDINLLVHQHNAVLAGIPDKDLLIAEINIQKVLHIKIYPGMNTFIRTSVSPSVKYLVGAQLQLLVSSTNNNELLGTIWAGYDLSGESPSGRNFRFWNSETQNQYWQETINSTLNRLNRTLVQIQKHDFVEFNPEDGAEYHTNI